jgi:hypothetical protein
LSLLYLGACSGTVNSWQSGQIQLPPLAAEDAAAVVWDAREPIPERARSIRACLVGSARETNPALRFLDDATVDAALGRTLAGLESIGEVETARDDTPWANAVPPMAADELRQNGARYLIRIRGSVTDKKSEFTLGAIGGPMGAVPVVVIKEPQHVDLEAHVDDLTLRRNAGHATASGRGHGGVVLIGPILPVPVFNRAGVVQTCEALGRELGRFFTAASSPVEEGY